MASLRERLRVSFGSSKNGAEGDDRDPSSSEETDTHIDNPLFRATEAPRTATFGPAVNRNAPFEEPTESTAPRLEPTAPMLPLPAAPQSRTPPLSAIAIVAFLALVIAYASCR
jgi:hypothetical protein